MCPEGRREESQEEIKNNRQYWEKYKQQLKVVTWEDVLKTLEEISPITNTVCEVVRLQFVEYLKGKFSFVHDYKKKLPHYRNSFNPHGNWMQEELVKKIWGLMPEPGARLSSGDKWCGYNIGSGNNDILGWYGFVNKDQIKNKETREAELIIRCNSDPFKGKLPDHFEKIDLVDWSPELSSWIINFDEKWDTKEYWRKRLEPFQKINNYD